MCILDVAMAFLFSFPFLIIFFHTMTATQTRKNSIKVWKRHLKKMSASVRIGGSTNLGSPGSSSNPSSNLSKGSSNPSSDVSSYASQSEN
jgi:hypothetical protein